MKSEFLGLKSQYGIVCDIHGDSEHWGNQQTRKANLIIKKGELSCMKCNGVYQATHEETISELNKNLQGELIVTGWVGGVYAGVQTRCNVTCKVHGDSCKWGNPWTPTCKRK